MLLTIVLQEARTQLCAVLSALRKMLEEKMDIRAKTISVHNTNLLQELEKVSNLNQSIMEQEIFTTEQSQQNSKKLQKEKEDLTKGRRKDKPSLR